MEKSFVLCSIMGNPLQHAVSSARKFGGEARDYIELHQLLDKSKRYIPDWRHRALMHTTFGIDLMEEHIIGPIFTRKSDGVELSTRMLVEEHIKEDMAGVIPTPADFLKEMPISHWMSGVDASVRRRMQQSNLLGSEDPPGVKETIFWHPGTKDPPRDGKYLVILHQSKEVQSAFFNKKSIRWLFSPSISVTFVKYWADSPVGPVD